MKTLTLSERFDLEYNIKNLFDSFGAPYTIITEDNYLDPKFKKHLADDLEDGSVASLFNNLVVIDHPNISDIRVNIGSCEYQVQSAFRSDGEAWNLSLIRL